MRRRPRGRWDRPELLRLLEQMRKGDILIVSRLDRLSRSLRDLLMIMERIKEAEAAFVSLSEAIDTTTAPGRMMMQMVGAFAEFERAILRERTKTGLEAARKEDRIGGRRPKLRPNQKDEIVAMVSAGTKTAADAARLFNVHPATVSRLLARAGAGTITGGGVMIPVSYGSKGHRQPRSWCAWEASLSVAIAWLCLLIGEITFKEGENATKN